MSRWILSLPLAALACGDPEPLESGGCAECECVARCGEGRLATRQVLTQGDGGLTGLDAPLDLAIEPGTGQAWVLVQPPEGAPWIVPLDLAGASVTLRADEAVLLPAGTTAIHASDDTLWYASEGGVGRLRPQDGALVAEEPSGPPATAFGAAGDGLWVLRDSSIHRLSGGTTEATGLDDVTGLSEDARVAVSRDEGALAWRDAAGQWQRVDFAAPGFEALEHAESVAHHEGLVLVGARGLHRYRLEPGGAPTPLGEVDLPHPHGIERGWDDETPATVHDVAFADGRVYATTVYGGYVLRWNRQGEALTGGEVVPVQPLVTDDDYDEDSLGFGTGFDPTEAVGLARLVPDGDQAWVLSALWGYIGHTGGGVAQQGQGGLLTLGGAYSAVVSPDGRHLYTGAWNAADPGVWVIGPGRTLAPGAVSGAPARPINYGTPDVAIAGDGAQVYAIDDEFNRLHVYDRDPGSGDLTWRATVGDEVPLSLLVGVAAAPDGRAIWACDFEEDTLVGYARDDATGEVTVAAVYVDGQAGVDGLHGAEDPVPSPDDRHLYVISYRDAAIARFERGEDAGAPQFVEAWRPDGDAERLFGIEAGAFTPDGSRLLVVSPVTDRFFVLGRSADGGLFLLTDASVPELNPGPALAEGQANPGRVAIAANGRTAVVTLRRWNAVATMALEPSGGLTWISTWTGPDQPAESRRWPNGVALHPDGGDAWVTTSLGDSLIGLRVQDRGPGEDDGCEGTCP